MCHPFERNGIKRGEEMSQETKINKINNKKEKERDIREQAKRC